MAKEPATETAPKAASPWLARLAPVGAWLRKHWIGSVLVVSLSVHGLGYWYAKAYLAPLKGVSPEVTLGAFEYMAAPMVQGVHKARFQLHVELVEPRIELARQQLAFHQFKLRQQLEMTLRDVRGTDFEDTQLAELKRLLMAQIENVVGPDLIHSVLITELALDYGASAAATSRPVSQANEESPRL